MSFQITALSPKPFASFFQDAGAPDAAPFAQIHVADGNAGMPCRVSLEDAKAGERVLLINHTHQPHETPFRASHAVYVREGAAQAHPAPGEVPAVFLSRQVAIRAFDAAHMMVSAEVVPGADLAQHLPLVLADPQIAYLQLHYAAQGCFAAQVTRG
ncbi:MAG: DUF1203 domain-containing protein [Pseudomonadota bacterium]